MNTTSISTKKTFNKNTLIFLIDIVLFFVLLHVLPFDIKANRGLALLVFIAILWLTRERYMLLLPF